MGELTGSGIETLTCGAHEFTKSGQSITTDLSDCLPSKVVLKSVEYCSDEDEFYVTVKDSFVSISATLSKADCPSSVAVASQSSCSGSGDPSVSDTPVCYSGSATKFGEKETVTVQLNSFSTSSSSGSLELTGSGSLDLTCGAHEFTKSGQSITTDLSDYLP